METVAKKIRKTYWISLDPIIKTISGFFHKSQSSKRSEVSTESIRARIKALGWTLREIPIKKNNPDPAKRVIFNWKITASKNGRTWEASGPTLDEGIKNIGKALGVISNS